MITLAWQKACRALRDAYCTNNLPDWPAAFNPRELAALQYPPPEEDSVAKKRAARKSRDDLVERIQASVEAGSLASTTRVVQAPMLTESQGAPPGISRRAGPGISRKGQVKPGEPTAEVQVIPCGDFAIWLTSQGETPSANIKAWIHAKVVEPQTAKKDDSETLAQGEPTVPQAKLAGVLRPPRKRVDNLAQAMNVGLVAYRAKYHTDPTARALFDWLAENDETGKIVDFDDVNDILTWTKSNGDCKDTDYKSFQGRFTNLMRK